MPSIDVGRYLAAVGDDTLTLDHVPSRKHPRGRTYEVAAPSLFVVLSLRGIMLRSGGALNNLSPADAELVMRMCRDDAGNPVSLQEKILGATLQQLVDDEVPLGQVDFITEFAVTYFGLGPAIAQQMFEDLAPARPARKSTPRKAAAKKVPAKTTAAKKAAPVKKSAPR